ncbi:hypothetical protein D3C83_47250 [compost metagenome]
MSLSGNERFRRGRTGKGIVRLAAEKRHRAGKVATEQDVRFVRAIGADQQVVESITVEVARRGH